MSPSRTKEAPSSTPLGDKLRLLGVGFQRTGNLERGRGLAQAADIVDGELAGFTGKALVDAIDRMLEQRLEAFVADVAAAVHDARPAPAPPLPSPAKPAASKPRANGARVLTVGATPLDVHPLETSHRRARSELGPRSAGARGERIVLTAIAQHSPEGVDSDLLSLLTGYKKSTRDEYLGRLVRRGLVVRNASRLAVVTNAGLAELGPFEALPTGDRLRAHYLATLPSGEREILGIVCSYFPHVVHRDRIGERAGYRKSTRDEYIGRLKRRRLVVVHGAGNVCASERLFDPKPAAQSAGAQS